MCAPPCRYLTSCHVRLRIPLIKLAAYIGGLAGLSVLIVLMVRSDFAEISNT